MYWMKSVIIAIVLFPLFNCALLASEKVLLDNNEIQEYRGKQGKWFMIKSKSQLDTLIKKNETQLCDVLKVNAAPQIRNILGGYTFVPYSEKMVGDLESLGHARSEIENGDDQFIWPISSVSILTSVFGLRWGEIHPGLDMPAPRGTLVRAAKDGRVISSGYMGGYGREIVIEHRNNYHTRYAHNSANFVKVGDFVRKGQAISLVGSSGRSTGSHLHFEIRLNGIPLDPLDFLPENSSLHVSEQRLKNWR